MAGDDGVVVGDQHGVGEAEAVDAVGDLADLSSRMGPGIALIGAKLLDPAHGDRGRGLLPAAAPGLARPPGAACAALGSGGHIRVLRHCVGVLGARPVTFCSGRALHPRIRYRSAFVKAGYPKICGNPWFSPQKI
jgi:hypothetical protein